MRSESRAELSCGRPDRPSCGDLATRDACRCSIRRSHGRVRCAQVVIGMERDRRGLSASVQRSSTPCWSARVSPPGIPVCYSSRTTSTRSAAPTRVRNGDCGQESLFAAMRPGAAAIASTPEVCRGDSVRSHPGRFLCIAAGASATAGCNIKGNIRHQLAGSASTPCPVIGTTNARASVRREARSISARKPRRGRQAGGAPAGDRALRVPRARGFLADKASVLGLQPLCLGSTAEAIAIA